MTFKENETQSLGLGTQRAFFVTSPTRRVQFGGRRSALRSPGLPPKRASTLSKFIVQHVLTSLMFPTRAHTGAPMNGNQAVMQQYNDFKWSITQLRYAAALRPNQDNKSQQTQTGNGGNGGGRFPSRKQPVTVKTAPAAADYIQAL